MFEYRVTVSAHGFAAHCREMSLSTEGETVAAAVIALRSAIDHANRLH
jgi:hypothetical protein